jgi:hypothetical protein
MHKNVHEIRYHGNSGGFQCDDCGMDFDKMREIEEHIRNRANAPDSDNTTENGRAQNRRVEIVIVANNQLKKEAANQNK